MLLWMEKQSKIKKHIYLTLFRKFPVNGKSSVRWWRRRISSGREVDLSDRRWAQNLYYNGCNVHWSVNRLPGELWRFGKFSFYPNYKKSSPLSSYFFGPYVTSSSFISQRYWLRLLCKYRCTLRENTTRPHHDPRICRWFPDVVLLVRVHSDDFYQIAPNHQGSWKQYRI